MVDILNTQQPIAMKKRYALLLLCFFLFAYIIPLGLPDLLEPDETRYAEIPREMIAGGDWIVPHLNGLRYFEKPALGYWVHAGSILLFGKNNFAVRLPSAMSVGVSALLIFLLVNNTSRNREEGHGFSATLAALVYLSSLEVFAVGNVAVLDSLLSLFLAATIIFFYFASEAQPGSRRETGYLLLSGMACGLAFLTKGFPAFAVPALALGPYLVWQRRYSDLLRMSWLPIVTAVVVALPWGILIHLREPDFWQFFIWNEHIRRFMADNAQHKESFWFFFMAAPGMFFPWAFLAPAAVPGIKDRLNEQTPRGRLIRLSICWLVLPFFFFSFSNGKLLTYILPCFPPFAVLMAFGLLHVLKKEVRGILFRGGIVASLTLSALILLAFLYIEFFGYHGVRTYSLPWKTMMAVDGFLFYILLCIWALRTSKQKGKALVFGMAPVFLFFVAHFIIPDQTKESKFPGPLMEKYRKDIGENAIIISDEETVRAACWYLQRSDVYLLGEAGELDYGLSYKDAEGRLLDMRSAVDLINRNRGKAAVVARMKDNSRWRNQLPKPVFLAESGPSGYGFWKY